MSDAHDIVVAGAGCAGLSAAVHLIETGMADRRMTLIDPRREYGRDRTWCAFGVMDHPFRAAVSHRWRQWSVRDLGHTVTRGSARHAYEHIASDAFYRLARERIAAEPKVTELLGTRVESIRDLGDRVVVRTDQRELSARLVLDARPPSFDDPPPRGHVRLLQQFVGWRIRTEDPSFDPEICTLMDFDDDARGGVHFTYVLPYSEHDALVEDTWFAAHRIDHARHEQSLQRWLERHGIEGYEVIERERGVLPMTTEPMVAAPSPRVRRIGLAGGLARPSTGYAFLAIQRQSRALAERLAREEAPDLPEPHTPRALFLDRVFLSFLARSPERGPEIFTRMFERTDPDALARFLSEASTVADDLRVMAALPALPFAAEAVRAHARLW